MGYDAMALGPLDLAVGAAVLAERMTEAQYPILSANVIDDSTGQLVARPFVLVSMGKNQVAIVGLTRLPNKPVDGFQVLDPAQAAPKVVADAAQHADTIILLTNLDYQSAINLTKNLSGVDLVVAALPTQIPDTVERIAGGALIVTADLPDVWGTGRRIGRLQVTLASNGDLSNEQWESIVLDGTIADDPEMNALLESYQSKKTLKNTSE